MKPPLAEGTRRAAGTTDDAGAARAPWTRWSTGALLLGALVIGVTHRTEERELLRVLGEAQPAWLLGGALLQAATYACAAAVWQRALASRGASRPLRLASLAPLAVAKLFTDQAVPSVGMSGTLLVVRGLARRGIARPDAVAAMLVGLVAFYAAYLTATVIALAVLWYHGELRPLILLPVALLADGCLLASRSETRP